MNTGWRSHRLRSGEKAHIRKKGWREVLSPIPEDDPDPDRQLKRQTVRWLFEEYAQHNRSYRWLAEQLNDRSVPGPGSHYHRQKESPGQSKWTCMAVRGILNNPVYSGTARFGLTSKGEYHRLVKGEIEPVQPGTKRTEDSANALLIPLERGGLIEKTLWNTVQQKIAERKRTRSQPRANGFLLNGLLYCGHCGGKMYGKTMRPKRGKKVYEYRKYTCGSPSVKPGTCRYYSVLEDEITDVLVDELLNVYLAPERLAGLEAQLTERTTKKHERAPGQAERLRKRLENLERDIRQASRNLLRVTEDAAFTEAQVALNELIAQRDQLQKDLETAERTQAEPVADAHRKVAEAIQQLVNLRERLQKARKNGKKTEALGEALRLLVSRVDLYFDSHPKGNKPCFRLVKGSIRFRPPIEVKGTGKQDK
jgi:hypothetical protein